ncbi:MAG: glycosyltransferase family 4 protein [Thermoplasmata archaeon]
MNIGIVSQTPLLRFSETFDNEPIVKLSELDREKYNYTIGGVSIMVNNLIRKMQNEKFAKKVFWFALNPNAPERIMVRDNLELYNIRQQSKMMKAYTGFKEILWNNIHGLKHEKFSIDEYLGFINYNWLVTKGILELKEEIDLLMIHDFQQLMVGSLIGPAKPAVLRWHIPFIPENFTAQIQKFIINGLEGFDTIIVSTKRDLEGLIRAGYRGVAYQIYPNIDPEKWPRASYRTAVSFGESYGIKEDDFMVLNVARMDPMKSQDVLIKAVALLKKSIPNLKLMLVGNGSFTSSSNGLGSSKGDLQKQSLKTLVKKLELENRVIFTGYLPDDVLSKAYERSNLFVLPSIIEGFGLSTVEAWIYDKVTIVSKGAGVSELITDGLNGYKFNSGRYKELSGLIYRVYKEERASKEIGKNAHRMAKQCYLSNVYKQTERVLKITLENFRHM